MGNNMGNNMDIDYPMFCYQCEQTAGGHQPHGAQPDRPEQSGGRRDQPAQCKSAHRQRDGDVQ